MVPSVVKVVGVEIRIRNVEAQLRKHGDDALARFKGEAPHLLDMGQCLQESLQGLVDVTNLVLTSRQVVQRLIIELSPVIHAYFSLLLWFLKLGQHSNLFKQHIGGNWVHI